MISGAVSQVPDVWIPVIGCPRFQNMCEAIVIGTGGNDQPAELAVEDYFSNKVPMKYPIRSCARRLLRLLYGHGSGMPSPPCCSAPQQEPTPVFYLPLPQCAPDCRPLRTYYVLFLVLSYELGLDFLRRLLSLEIAARNVRPFRRERG